MHHSSEEESFSYPLLGGVPQSAAGWVPPLLSGNSESDQGLFMGVLLASVMIAA